MMPEEFKERMRIHLAIDCIKSGRISDNPNIRRLVTLAEEFLKDLISE